MSDNTLRVVYSDGRTEEVPYQLLPAARLQLEEKYGRSLYEVYVEQASAGMFEEAFHRSVWLWFVFRRNETRSFEEWLATTDEVGFIGETAEKIQALRDAEDSKEDPDPLSEADSSTESAVQQTS